ncbi:hypothetical protein GCM10011504_43400 [Siccirubricoccus deserti]|uniref:Uncharacterized protein n=1 Tax=Siccirubricoccus deserti TaxID=2013562 RepID=A0A9X0R2I1_9PROT|nr:hypothetical protein [Siccirubricoccus deserti]MBC4017603.1 hypothetical protein [Siccirubricoccus deserti]GGC60464.1 hypothetical protein GCM10011504_43400 [Siccirubricoccus deserti]
MQGRGLLVTAGARTMALPEVPTLAEAAECVPALGLEPADDSPEVPGALIRADTACWAEVMRRAHIQSG